jgi:hypothetical protein
VVLRRLADRPTALRRAIPLGPSLSTTTNPVRRIAGSWSHLSIKVSRVSASAAGSWRRWRRLLRRQASAQYRVEAIRAQVLHDQAWAAVVLHHVVHGDRVRMP